METISCIFTRRSVRKFAGKEIPAEHVELLVKAAMFAPSARNMQPWQFLVIDEREKLNALSRIHPYGKMLKESALAILICGDKRIEPHEGYLCLNCAAATQNILLAAHDLGLGSVWLGVYPRPERIQGIHSYFELPGYILPISLISLGYPAEEKENPERYKKERLHFNGW